MKHFVTKSLFALPPPYFLIRRYLLDANADDDLCASVRHAIARVKPNVLARRLREALSLNPTALQIATPCMYINARRDKLLRMRHAQLQKYFHDLRWEELDAPHLVLQSAPQEAANLLVDFLQRV